MGTTQSKVKKTDSYDTLGAKLVGAIAGIKTNLASNRPVQLRGQAKPAGTVSADMQAYVDQNKSTNAARKQAATLATARKAARKAAAQELADFMKWALVVFGDPAYEMFGQPAPKPRAPKSTTSATIAAQKRLAKSKAKAKAKAAAAPPTETVVAFDVSGNPIGGHEVLPSTNTNPTPAPVTAPTVAGK